MTKNKSFKAISAALVITLLCQLPVYADVLRPLAAEDQASNPMDALLPQTRDVYELPKDVIKILDEQPDITDFTYDENRVVVKKSGDGMEFTVFKRNAEIPLVERRLDVPELLAEYNKINLAGKMFNIDPSDPFVFTATHLAVHHDASEIPALYVVDLLTGELKVFDDVQIFSLTDTHMALRSRSKELTLYAISGARFEEVEGVVSVPIASNFRLMKSRILFEIEEDGLVKPVLFDIEQKRRISMPNLALSANFTQNTRLAENHLILMSEDSPGPTGRDARSLLNLFRVTADGLVPVQIGGPGTQALENRQMEKYDAYYINDKYLVMVKQWVVSVYDSNTGAPLEVNGLDGISANVSELFGDYLLALDDNTNSVFVFNLASPRAGGRQFKDPAGSVYNCDGGELYYKRRGNVMIVNSTSTKPGKRRCFDIAAGHEIPGVISFVSGHSPYPEGERFYLRRAPGTDLAGAPRAGAAAQGLFNDASAAAMGSI
ncbi:MAG: hypothetical protein ABH825_04735 [Candidatus Omnitrophota bacterium]